MNTNFSVENEKNKVVLLALENIQMLDKITKSSSLNLKVSVVSFQTIRRDLMNSLRKRRPYLYDSAENVILNQDYGPSHTAAMTQLEINVLGLQRAVHPPYLPDRAHFTLFTFHS